MITDLNLIKQAQLAQNFAYSPYYNFKVGAAIVSDSGQVFTGCNIETAAGNTICAERVAISKAISSGVTNFSKIAVVGGDGTKFVSPCGLCRQFLFEFAPTLNVLMHNGEDVKEIALKELLPHTFSL